MQIPRAAAGISCLASALAWAGAIQSAQAPEWTPLQSLALSAGSLILATAALVAMVVRGSRWGRRLAVGLSVGQLGLAILIPISSWWWAGVALAGSTLAIAGGPWTGSFGKGPQARLGPPSQAVLLLCLLACLPVALAAVSVNGLGGGWGLAGLSAGTAAAYAKALPGSLMAARFLMPTASVVAAFTTPWPGWILAIMGGGATTWVAWSSGARLAVRPLVDPGPPPVPEPTPLRIRSASAGLRSRPGEDRPERNTR